MRSFSIHVGRLFGIEVRLHLTFLILPVFVFWTEYNSHGSANGPRDLALVGIVLACVAAHEAAHILMARRAGLIPKVVILLPLSGVTVFDESRVGPRKPGAEVWKRDVRIALIGPLVNLVFAALAAAVIFATVPGVKLWEWPWLQPSNLPRSLVWANLYLAGLNLLPAYPLDGGRILRAFFARSIDPAAATRRAVSISHAMAMILMVAGLFSNAWLTMVGIIIFSAAQLEERAVIFQSVLEDLRLEEVMLTDFATLSPADTLEDALEKAVHSLQDDFPVVRGSDMVGVISRQRILEALRVEGNGYVQAVMNKIFEVSVRQESLATAFRKLTSRNLSIIPVVEDQRLVGIVTLQNLMHSMALLAESKKLRRDESNS
ncbi:MAG TPA: site-2 protease family protein [Candidatus Sulfotelmatobacter sp.]|jgi:Zn-dependent protease/CBS domain-containing protein|nr:site-2 protease family protein [Terracidiphilus sp.]HTC56071.1 site-2 protease family protein [Candidatus Sulfotelmatobacter sp.]